MLNKVILMGRLTADTEMRMSTSGKEVISFKIAVNRRFQRDTTDFISCVAWGNTAKFIHNHFSKGQMINVVGSVQVREWEAPDGSKRYATEVVCDEANFCGDKPKADPLDDVVDTLGGTQYTSQEFAPVEDNDEDLPF